MSEDILVVTKLLFRDHPLDDIIENAQMDLIGCPSYICFEVSLVEEGLECAIGSVCRRSAHNPRQRAEQIDS